MDDKQIKKLMKPEFAKNYEKYYPVKTLRAMGYERYVCKHCGRGFWSQTVRDFCDEAECSGGYRFIGESLTRKKFEYKEAWDTYVKTFEPWGYVPLERYPVVSRWYDDLYFVAAGINDFQPYVVSGEIEPPADAVLEPQFCLRFPDIDNVGITGRHYTGFIMVGQHTFNTPDKHVYFKEEGIGQIQHFLTQAPGHPRPRDHIPRGRLGRRRQLRPVHRVFQPRAGAGQPGVHAVRAAPRRRVPGAADQGHRHGRRAGALGVVQPGPADVVRRDVPEDHGAHLQQGRLEAGP